MLSVWTKNLRDKEEQGRFINSLLGAKHVLERQTELLKEEEAALDNFELSAKSYDIPNWDYKQAHTNGFRAALRLVYKLNNLDSKETNNGRQPNNS